MSTSHKSPSSQSSKINYIALSVIAIFLMLIGLRFGLLGATMLSVGINSLSIIMIAYALLLIVYGYGVGARKKWVMEYFPLFASILIIPYIVLTVKVGNVIVLIPLIPIGFVVFLFYRILQINRKYFVN